MGRPLNKKFFQDGSAFTIGCFYHDGSSVVGSVIISQRSNSSYRIAGAGGTPLVFTSLAFADANPDTITRTGGADLTLTFGVGDLVRVASSENAGENNGVFEIATVTSTVITLTGDGALVANVDDTTATLALVDSAGVEGSLVQNAPAALGEIQVVVEVDSQADESARIINAHQVKTFEGNTYVWNDTGGAGGSRGDFLEANLQAATT